MSKIHSGHEKIWPVSAGWVAPVPDDAPPRWSLFSPLLSIFHLLSAFLLSPVSLPTPTIPHCSQLLSIFFWCYIIFGFIHCRYSFLLTTDLYLEAFARHTFHVLFLFPKRREVRIDLAPSNRLPLFLIVCLNCFTIFIWIKNVYQIRNRRDPIRIHCFGLTRNVVLKSSRNPWTKSHF